MARYRYSRRQFLRLLGLGIVPFIYWSKRPVPVQAAASCLPGSLPMGLVGPGHRVYAPLMMKGE